MPYVPVDGRHGQVALRGELLAVLLCGFAAEGCVCGGIGGGEGQEGAEVFGRDLFVIAVLAGEDFAEVGAVERGLACEGVVGDGGGEGGRWGGGAGVGVSVNVNVHAGLGFDALRDLGVVGGVVGGFAFAGHDLFVRVVYVVFAIDNQAEL